MHLDKIILFLLLTLVASISLGKTLSKQLRGSLTLTFFLLILASPVDKSKRSGLVWFVWQAA